MYTSNVSMQKKAQVATGNASAVNQPIAYAQSNPLVDKNYGSLLVKNKKVSFTGMANIAPNLGARISQNLPFLKRGEVLMVGKELQSTFKLLQESADAFKIGIKKVLFLADPKVEGAFAFYAKGKGRVDLVNLSKDALKVDFPGYNNVLTVTKGGSIDIQPGDKIITKNETIELYDVVMSPPPIYKVGYGPMKERDSVDSRPATIKKVGFGETEEKVRIKGRSTQPVKTIGYGKNEEKNISKLGKSTKMNKVGFGPAEERPTVKEDAPIYKIGFGPREVRPEPKEAPLHLVKQGFTVKGFSQKK